MDMSKFRPESHVAQQSLRDNLRVPQAADFPNSINPDLIQVRSDRNDHLLFDPDVFSSGIFHGSSSSNVFTAQSGAILHLELQTAQEHRQMLDEESSLSGYASGLAGSESNQDPWFVGEVMSNNARASSISAATQYLKPSYGNLQFVSPSLYQNAQLDFLSTASIGTQEFEVASHEHQSVRMDFCGNQANPLQCRDAGAWINKPLVEQSQQWCDEMGYLACKRSVDLRAAASDAATTQGLVLSLSSNPTYKIYGADVVQFTEDEYGYVGFHSRARLGEFKELQDSVM